MASSRTMATKFQPSQIDQCPGIHLPTLIHSRSTKPYIRQPTRGTTSNPWNFLPLRLSTLGTPLRIRLSHPYRCHTPGMNSNNMHTPTHPLHFLPIPTMEIDKNNSAASIYQATSQFLLRTLTRPCTLTLTGITLQSTDLTGLQLPRPHLRISYQYNTPTHHFLPRNPFLITRCRMTSQKARNLLAWAYMIALRPRRPPRQTRISTTIARR